MAPSGDNHQRATGKLGDKGVKWFRIATSIAALYVASSLHGAVVPLISEWEWASGRSNATVNPEKSSPGAENPAETRMNFEMSLIFVSTGFVEMLASPLTGMTADHYGFDTVILFGLLVATVKCLLYGVISTDVSMVLTNRLLQGVISACMQGIAFARIRDVYTQATKQYMNVMAVALCKMAASLLIGFVTGELYHIANHFVFFLFLPINLLLMIGIGLTYRSENFHSSRKSHAVRHGRADMFRLQLRVAGDVQLIIISFCFLVSNLGQTALEPSIALRMKSVFGAGPETTGVVLGLCGVVTIASSLASAQIVAALQARTWIFCSAALFTAGLPLVLVNFSPNIFVAIAALCTHFIGATASRFTLLTMCSTIANDRYPQAFGLVFSVLNMGWAASDVLGPLLASCLFGPPCVICIVGASCTVCCLFPLCLRQLESVNGPNVMDCFTSKIDQPEYKMIIDQSKVAFTYDISKETLPKVENEYW